jgi:hypothetical protein
MGSLMGSAIKATRLFLAIYASLLLVPAWAQQLDIEDYQPLSIQQLEAIEVGRYPAQEARQGAAADADHIYAIVNYIIGKYDKTSGDLIQRWQGSSRWTYPPPEQLLCGERETLLRQLQLS